MSGVNTSLRFKAFCDANNDRSDRRSGRIPVDSNVNTAVMTTNDSRPSSEGKLQCCCGRPGCAYLESNNTILGGIERDLDQAARMGQALLTRHESYISESQQEHERLTTYIAGLEQERISLQTTNDKIVEENRLLLNQLETANTSLKDSDNHVKSLEALLRDCEVEVRRLNGLTRRTEELELQILEFEKSRLVLLKQSDDSNEETRSTIKRWRESEARVRELEQDVQRIEWDAKKDKERYEEMIARLERERVLGNAEGRLKGAAAVRGLDGEQKSPSVVSHFVRDILGDNANLQAGIIELRDLLQTSNEEVQNLREQVLLHQPLEQDESSSLSQSVPLSEQLGWSNPTSKVQQSVHVHHHYHAKSAKRERTPTIRRTSRKRSAMSSGMLPSTPESSAPATPLVAPHRFVSSPVLPTSLYHPQPTRNRWSMQSGATGSSMISSYPSSPRSAYEQPGSIFDRLEAEEESSRPTSPESVGLATSPPGKVSSVKFGGLAGIPDMTMDRLDEESKSEDFNEEIDNNPGDVDQEPELSASLHKGSPYTDSHELTPKPSQLLVDRAAESSPALAESLYLDTGQMRTEEPPAAEAVEQADVRIELFSLVVGEPKSSPAPFDPASDVVIRPSLRRKGSHDSLVSISGMDIHIAKRPEQDRLGAPSLFSGNKSYFSQAPSTARRMPSAQPLATVTEYTALSSLRSFSTDASSSPSIDRRQPQRSASSSVAALSGIAGMHAPPPEDQQQSGGFGRLVGGWVRSKWGIAPTKSSTDLRSSAASISTSSSTSTSAQAPASLNFPGGRLPGINQSGPILGFRAAPKLTGVQVKMVNEEGLRESLAE